MDIVNRAIVIDNGTSEIRAGIAGEEAPRCRFSNVIGKNRMSPIMIGFEQKNHYIGTEAEERKGVLNLKSPMQRGIVEDWDNMQKIWQHIYMNEIKIQPDESPCLITEVPINPFQNRNKISEIMFEYFKVPKLYIALQSVLSLYATGRVTGLVLDIGDGVSSVVPVYDGFCVKEGIYRLDIGGRDITEYLQQQIQHKLQTKQSFALVNHIKETKCYIPNDNQTKEDVYTLPDGNNLKLTSHNLKVPEILFDPSILGSELPGIHEYLKKSIKKCDKMIVKELRENIYLNGGSSMFKGINERLQKELMNDCNQNTSFNIISPPERRLSVLTGGIILASLTMFQNMWITKKDYQEHGQRILYKYLI